MWFFWREDIDEPTDIHPVAFCCTRPAPVAPSRFSSLSRKYRTLHQDVHLNGNDRIQVVRQIRPNSIAPPFKYATPKRRN